MKQPLTRVYVSYLRVSTHRQGHAGLGIEAQRTAVASFISYTGGELKTEIVEVESGSRTKRPGLVQSIALCQATGATLVIAKLDRLARNVAFVSSLMESGVDFIAVDAPYANKLMIHILAAFAEHEREQISERTRLALSAAKARGIELGVNGKHLAARHRQEAIKFAQSVEPEVIAAILDGVSTLAEMALHLNVRGTTSRLGTPWSPGTVQRLLKRLSIVLPSQKHCLQGRSR
jgi:DNA invertase Pin-like site-specific DNA recombinase